MNMKKFFLGILGLLLAGVLLLSTTTTSRAAKPATNGFDVYGYNYTAYLFNGWYGQWAAKPAGLGWYGTTLDAYLVMKWSKDWIPQADEPVGAWVTNHWSWYSNDYDEGTWYGFNTRVPWLSKDTEPVACYKLTEFAKIMRVSDDPIAWANYEVGGAYDAGWGSYTSGVPYYVVFQDVIDVLGKSWDLTGNWALNFNSTLWPSGNPYAHSLIVTGDTASGASTGNTYNATISADCGTVTIVATYLAGSAAYPYTYTAVGSISDEGTLSGTWTDTFGDSGTWSSVSGAAVGSWLDVDEINLSTTAPKGLGKPLW